MTLCIGTSFLAGCAASHKGENGSPTEVPESKTSVADATPSAPPIQQSPGWTTTPLPAADSVAVKQGGVPLIYLVESPGLFRVHDQTDGRDIARFNAPGRSIVRIDGRAGVVFGGETLYAGPLDPSHRFVIYLDPTGPNMARQGVFEVTPPRKGGTQSQSAGDEGGRRADH